MFDPEPESDPPSDNYPDPGEIELEQISDTNPYPPRWLAFLSQCGIQDPILFFGLLAGSCSGSLVRYIPKLWMNPKQYKLYSSIMFHVGLGMFLISCSDFILETLQISLAKWIPRFRSSAPQVQSSSDPIRQPLRFQYEPVDEDFNVASELDGTFEDSSRFNHMCTNCRRVFKSSALIYGTSQGLIKPSETYKLYSSIAEIAAGINQKCHFCVLISLMLVGERKLTRDELGITEPVMLNIANDLFCPTNIPNIWIDPPKYFGKTTSKPWGHSHWDHSHWDFRVGRLPLYDSKRPAGAPPWYRPLMAYRPTASYHSTGSSAHRKLMLDWYNDCCLRHDQCRQISTPFVPSRLIAISDDPKACLSLYLTSPRDINTKYCALSHCWGGAAITCLTSQNLTSFRTSIPLHSLPQTFRDAVTITKTLGLRFLWIDSLCIIQDSHADWAYESALMGQVYESAQITVAAVGGSDSNAGCFITHNPLQYENCRIAGDKHDGLDLYPSESSSLRRGYRKKYNEIGEFQPLNSRCWAFQERLMSRRMIHFGSLGIMWTCRCAWSDESELKMCPNPMTDETRAWRELAGLDCNASTATIRQPPKYIPWHEPHDSPTDNREISREAQFHRNWAILVEQYADRELTKPNDRLIALSGVVQRIQQNTGMTYLAGLWDFGLHLHLMWTVNNMPVKIRPPGGYRAPTWSWASVDSGWILNIGFLQPHENIDSMIQLVGHDIKCHPADTSKTGEVLSASLFLKAKIKSFSKEAFEMWSPNGDPSNPLASNRWASNSWDMHTSAQDLGTLHGDLPGTLEDLESVYLLLVFRGHVESKYSYSNQIKLRLKIKGFADESGQGSKQHPVTNRELIIPEYLDPVQLEPRARIAGLALRRCERIEPQVGGMPDAGKFYYERIGYFTSSSHQSMLNTAWFNDVESQIVELR